MLNVVVVAEPSWVPQRLHYTSGRPSTTLGIGPPIDYIRHRSFCHPGGQRRFYGRRLLVDRQIFSVGTCTRCMHGWGCTYTILLLLGQIRNLQVAPVGGLDEFYLHAHALSWTESDSVKGSV